MTNPTPKFEIGQTVLLKNGKIKKIVGIETFKGNETRYSFEGLTMTRNESFLLEEYHDPHKENEKFLVILWTEITDQRRIKLLKKPNARIMSADEIFNEGALERPGASAIPLSFIYKHYKWHKRWINLIFHIKTFFKRIDD